ncbi:hypothetical protein BDN71DRAFT_1436597 [Pleurotus eryngii]|uniref:Uncharacterized protein n=1 Tax=Pleurotus eryngii TaxID=5323 RepID=A0A9P6D0M6_PLEER|nr:hypothetical protein BDN71DRAFT_1436597 [Pleurotus eryngii]
MVLSKSKGGHSQGGQEVEGGFPRGCAEARGERKSGKGGRGNAREARKRGRADERSVRDSASALMLRPPSPAVSRFRREHGESEASILEGGARGIPKVRVSERGVRGDP